MKISNVGVKNDGYVHCKSDFYSAQDILSSHLCYAFSPGINTLYGEIDSGNWAVSYLLSMYKHRPKDFVLFDQPKVTVNDDWIGLDELAEFSCYMDRLDPLFSSSLSVKEQIIKGLKYSKLHDSYEDIQQLFCLDSERFERPLKGVGNEIFRAMAAIGFAYKKEIFCFPWLSNKRFEGYHENLTGLLRILEGLGKVVILPVGMSSSKDIELQESHCRKVMQ